MSVNNNYYLSKCRRRQKKFDQGKCNNRAHVCSDLAWFSSVNPGQNDRYIRSRWSGCCGMLHVSDFLQSSALLRHVSRFRCVFFEKDGTKIAIIPIIFTVGSPKGKRRFFSTFTSVNSYGILGLNLSIIYSRVFYSWCYFFQGKMSIHEWP